MLRRRKSACILVGVVVLVGVGSWFGTRDQEPFAILRSHGGSVRWQSKDPPSCSEIEATYAVDLPFEDAAAALKAELVDGTNWTVAIEHENAIVLRPPPGIRDYEAITLKRGKAVVAWRPPRAAGGTGNSRSGMPQVDPVAVWSESTLVTTRKMSFLERQWCKLEGRLGSNSSRTGCVYRPIQGSTSSIAECRPID